jgi:hypothetical protein
MHIYIQCVDWWMIQEAVSRDHAQWVLWNRSTVWCWPAQCCRQTTILNDMVESLEKCILETHSVDNSMCNI